MSDYFKADYWILMRIFLPTLLIVVFYLCGLSFYDVIYV